MYRFAIKPMALLGLGIVLTTALIVVYSMIHARFGLSKYLALIPFFLLVYLSLKTTFVMFEGGTKVSISIKKQPGRFYIMQDDKIIGEAWRMIGTQGFGFSLRGIYWRRCEPNRVSGSPATYSRRLKDVPALPQLAIDKLAAIESPEVTSEI